MMENDVTQERFVSFLLENGIGQFVKVVYTDWDTEEICVETGILEMVRTEEEDWGESVHLVFEDKYDKRDPEYSGLPMEIASDFVIFIGDDCNVACYGSFEMPNIELNICKDEAEVNVNTKEYLKEAMRNLIYMDSNRINIGNEFKCLDEALYEFIGQWVTIASASLEDPRPYTVSMFVTSYSLKTNRLSGIGADGKIFTFFFYKGLDFVITTYEPLVIVGYTAKDGYWKAETYKQQ